MICINTLWCLLQRGKTAFDVAMENGHVSLAGCLLLVTVKLDDVAYEVKCLYCIMGKLL